MGLQIVLNIHQAEDVVFSDITLMNQFLMKQGMGELYDEFENDYEEFEGPFVIETKVLKVAQNWDGGFEGYEQSTMIWGCFGEREMKTIARFLIGGKIVFHIDIEGNPDEWWVITPGKVEERKIAF